MLKTLVLLLVIAGQQPAESKPELVIIVGNLTPATETMQEPARVILLPPQYATLWVSDVQKRLDVYWERYKTAFAQRKEFFFEVSKMAHRDALEYAVTRMQRDTRLDAATLIKTTADGKFEFNNVAPGEYRLVAIARKGAEDLLWQEVVEVSGPTPLFVRLKQINP